MKNKGDSEVQAEPANTVASTQWEAVFSRAGWGVSIASPENKFIRVNNAFARMHGTTSPDDWINAPLLDMLADESKPLLPQWTDAAAKAGHISYESIHVRKDGSRFPVLAEVTVVTNEQGQMLYRVAHYQDISEMKKAEKLLKENIEEQKYLAEVRNQALKEANEAIQARDEFLSIASHELKTPLTSILLQLQFLDHAVQKHLYEKLPVENESNSNNMTLTKLAKCIRTSEEQAKRLAQLLDKLLDFTRLRLGRLILSRENVNLSVLLTNVIDRLKTDFNSKGIDVTLNSDPNIEGFWDPMRMEQVITNLLSNALKYGGNKPIQVIAGQGTEKAILKVIDQGIGVAPEMHRKIFERFERALKDLDISGFGLGLYITRQIIEAHGGRIGVESELGKGSKFTVEIPLTNFMVTDHKFD